MNGLTNYITERPWVDTITDWYVHVDDAYVRLLARRGYTLRTSGPEHTFSDSEVITVSLIIETFFQGHEEVGYAFVAQYLRDLFPQLLDLDRFNARRRELIAVIEAIRRDLRDQKLARADPLRLVDSAPIALMTCTRGARCHSVVGNEYFGVVTSKKGKVFGLRLHLTATAEQLIDEWLLAPASYPDAKVLEARSWISTIWRSSATKATSIPIWRSACGEHVAFTSSRCAATIRRRNGQTTSGAFWVACGIELKPFSGPERRYSMLSARGAARWPATSCGSPPAFWLIG